MNSKLIIIPKFKKNLKEITNNFEKRIQSKTNSNILDISITRLLPSCRSSVNLQDPFADGGDPAFSRRNALTPNSQGYQPGMGGPEITARMGPYESNKDPFGGMRKGERQPDQRLRCCR